MPIVEVADEPDNYQIYFQVDLGNGVVVGMFQVGFSRGASGLSEPDMDQAVQSVVDHIATLPNLATGSLTATKANIRASVITPTEGQPEPE